jgi:hypothetical protein
MKSTERHTADTQITDAAEYCKIEATGDLLHIGLMTLIIISGQLTLR